MISIKLIAFIEKHAEDLTSAWLKEVQQHPETLSHHHYSAEKLRDFAFSVYSHLGEWIESDANRHKVEKTFRELGSESFQEGFRLSEVVKAIALVKNHLWRFVLNQGFLESATELYQTLELISSVIQFFDRAIFFTIRGFETEAHLHRIVHPVEK